MKRSEAIIKTALFNNLIQFYTASSYWGGPANVCKHFLAITTRSLKRLNEIILLKIQILKLYCIK